MESELDMTDTDVAEPNKDTFERAHEFSEKYANNVQFESNVWDLRILFGLLDQSGTPTTVQQHTAINVPWQQAKLMTYFLYANVLLHESVNGRIKIADSVMPPPIGEFFDKWQEDAKLKLAIEYLEQMRTKFLGAADGNTAKD